MKDPLALDLRSTKRSLELCYPLSTAALVLVATAAILGIDSLLVPLIPGLPHLWPVITRASVLVMAGLVMWLVWWSTIAFDRTSDRVTLGFVTVGRVSEIAAIERGLGGQGPLEVVFRDPEGGDRRWAIRGVPERQVLAVGSRLADDLRVPFR
jgi:hypothetical protein